MFKILTFPLTVLTAETKAGRSTEPSMIDIFLEPDRGFIGSDNNMVNSILLSKERVISHRNFLKRHKELAHGLEQSVLNFKSKEPGTVVLEEQSPIEMEISHNQFHFKGVAKDAYVESLVLFDGTVEKTFRFDHLPLGTLSSYITRIQNPTKPRTLRALKTYSEISDHNYHSNSLAEYIILHYLRNSDGGPENFSNLLRIISQIEDKTGSIKLDISLDHIFRTYEYKYNRKVKQAYFTVVNGQWRGATRLIDNPQP